MNWPILSVYLMLATALVAGSILGYRRGHRALTALFGPALGAGLVIVANTMMSNDSINGGDLSWRIIFAFVGFAIVLVYLLGFALGGVADVFRRKLRGSP